MSSFVGRIKNAWNAFRNTDHNHNTLHGGNYGYRPDRIRMRYNIERVMLASIYSRISIDAASVSIRHVRKDTNGRYIEDIQSGLNECLTVRANIDQTGRAFVQDIVSTMIYEGVVAVVPTDTSTSPISKNVYDILTMRVGTILEWYPEHVKVSLYNESIGRREDLLLPKKMVAIIENPLYSVMNEPNSTLKRLIHKLNILDDIDEQSGSGKLDLIIQLPYVIKSEARRKQAEQRRKDIEFQLAGSKYGIAYTDGSERITQLNRPAENNLMKQIEYLTSMLYSQLGMTEKVFDGTADESEMINYYNRTIEPILGAVADALDVKFITKTARTQGQAIAYFRDPFKLVPVSGIADIADKFTRNEILSSNEMRAIIGYKPVDHPAADELSNKNLNKAEGEDKAVVDRDRKEEEIE